MTKATSLDTQQTSTGHRETLYACDNQIIDCKVLESKGIDSINSKLYFMGIELTGGTESNKPHNECFFGELDSKNTMGLDDTKPIYQLIDNSVSVIASEAKQSSNTNTDSKTNNIESNSTQSHKGIGNSTIQVFLDSNTLTLLNYSLLDSSLNIKLECNSSESKVIVEKEKAQREQQKQQDSQTQDSSLIAQNDKSQSTSMLHPILEDNEIKCPHNGVVKLKANRGKSFTSKGIPMVLESDLLNAPIIGCTNPLLSGGPCTSVAVILPSARGLKKFNDDYPIMQDLVSSGCLSDKVKQEIKTYGADK